MPRRAPIDAVFSQLTEQGFRLAAYSRAGQLFEHEDGRRLFVVVAGRYAVDVMYAHDFEAAWELLDGWAQQE